ncbi:MAG: DUF2461 family protein [candidate division Zixibacteria bacterium]|nr:DUF2461 family protein [candidate division Zixibacteria bacterium]
MNKVPSFSGFPEECFHFLRELAVNNNREWFNARKADYLNNVLLHTQTFVVALGDRLKMLCCLVGLFTIPGRMGAGQSCVSIVTRVSVEISPRITLM